MTPTVPAKHELVQVVLEVRLADAVQRADEPAFQIGDGPVDPLQQDVRRHFAHDLWPMVIPLRLVVQAEVRRVAVREHDGPGGDIRLDECMQRLPAVVADGRQADPPRLAILAEFNGADDGQFAHQAASLAACDRVVDGAVGHGGLIHLDPPGQLAALRVDHGAPELLEHQPGGVVTAQAEGPVGLLG